MQLMPNTAAEYGLDTLGTPQENVNAGIQYLKWLDKQFENKVPDSIERRKFVLGAYNVGLGHIFDAIRLAKEFNLKPVIWEDNVAEMLLKKSNPKYYNNNVVHYGYCRGKEPFRYVNEIYARYEHYVNITEL
jgi:membrane-bound lytic murein transglycosylase F